MANCMQRILFGLCLIVALAASSFAQQVQSTAVDLRKPNSDFSFLAAEQTTPTLRAYIRENGGAYTTITNLGGVFFFASNATDEVGMAVTNTARGTDYLEWTLTKNQTALPGTYFAQIIVTNNAGSVQEWVRGEFVIEDSPGTAAITGWEWSSTNYATVTWVNGQIAAVQATITGMVSRTEFLNTNTTVNGRITALYAPLTNGTADLDIDTLRVRGALTASAAGLTDFPTSQVSSVINGGTSGLTGSVSRIGGAVTIVFPTGGGGGGGSTNLSGLSDVTVTSPSQGQTLVYDETLAGWTNGAASGEGLGTNRLTWVVGGETIGYVDTNGITMLKGSLQLYEEDLHCNVQAYDGARTAPSISFFAQPKMGWYRKSYGGDYAWTFAHNSNDVMFLHQSGLTLASTNGIGAHFFEPTGAFRANGTNGITTNLSVITSVLTNGSGVVTGLVSQTLNIRKGIILP
jgi:hypothetical protein